MSLTQCARSFAYGFTACLIKCDSRRERMAKSILVSPLVFDVSGRICQMAMDKTAMAGQAKSSVKTIWLETCAIRSFQASACVSLFGQVARNIRCNFFWKLVPESYLRVDESFMQSKWKTGTASFLMCAWPGCSVGPLFLHLDVSMCVRD